MRKIISISYLVTFGAIIARHGGHIFDTAKAIMKALPKPMQAKANCHKFGLIRHIHDPFACLYCNNSTKEWKPRDEDHFCFPDRGPKFQVRNR